MKRIIFFLIVCTQFGYAFSQENMKTEFMQFLTRFPKKEWKDLESIRLSNIKESHSQYDTIPILIANRNMWYDETYNHVKNKKDVGYKYGPLPPPHYRTIDGRFYNEGRIGIFSNARGWYYNEQKQEWLPSDEYNQVYPLAQIDLYDDVVMLVVGYKYMGNNPTHEYCIDAYTYIKSTQQMRSAIVLSEDYVDWREYEIAMVKNDTSIVSFYFKYKEQEDDDYPILIKGELMVKKLRINKDGYLTIMSESDVNYGMINDSDGYTNVREEPNTKSKIIDTIPSESLVYYKVLPNSQWYSMLYLMQTIEGQSTLKEVHGYIHKSRVKQ